MSRKFLIITLVLVGFATYFTALFNGFLWDDEQFIQKNVFITSPSYLPQIFTTNTIAGAGHNSNYYRPLTTMVFMLEYQLWGLSPFGFHLTNILVHVGAAVVLFLLLERLGLGQKPSFWISLIFAIHPIQTEAVSYANSLGDSLSAVFLFASLWVFADWVQRAYRHPGALAIGSSRDSIGPAGLQNDIKNMGLIILLFSASLLSKEVSLAAAPLFLLMGWWKLGSRAVRDMRVIGTVGGLLGVTIGYILLRLTVLNFGNSLNFYGGHNVYTDSLAIRLFTFAKVVWIYLGLLLFPYPLHMERTTELVTTPWSVWVIGAVGLVGAILWLSYREYKQKKTVYIFFGAVWAFFTILPTSGIVPISGILYEHWLYTPMVGVLIVAYGVWQLLSEKLKVKSEKLRKAGFYTGIILCIVYAFLTIRQNYFWSDPVTFYTYTLQYADSSRLHNNLAMSYANEGQSAKSIPEYQKAIALGDVYPQTHHNMGNAYFELGDYKKAEAEYLKALQIDPSFFFTYPKLVNLYLATKQEKKALPYLQKLHTLYPQDEQVEKLIEEITAGK